MKKLGLIIISGILFSGCGGGGDNVNSYSSSKNTPSIGNKNKITINNNVNLDAVVDDMIEDSDVLNNESKKSFHFYNLITFIAKKQDSNALIKVLDNNLNCKNYGFTDDDLESKSDGAYTGMKVTRYMHIDKNYNIKTCVQVDHSKKSKLYGNKTTFVAVRVNY